MVYWVFSFVLIRGLLGQWKANDHVQPVLTFRPVGEIARSRLRWLHRE